MYLSVKVRSHREGVVTLRTLREGHHPFSLIQTSMDFFLLNLKIGQPSYSGTCTNGCPENTYHVPDVEFSLMSRIETDS